MLLCADKLFPCANSIADMLNVEESNWVRAFVHRPIETIGQSCKQLDESPNMLK